MYAKSEFLAYGFYVHMCVCASRAGRMEGTSLFSTGSHPPAGNKTMVFSPGLHQGFVQLEKTSVGLDAAGREEECWGRKGEVYDGRMLTAKLFFGLY